MIRSGGLKEVVVVLHLRPARDHVAGDLELGTSSTLLPRADPRSKGGGLDERKLRRPGGWVEGSSESKPAIALRHLSHWPRRISL